MFGTRAIAKHLGIDLDDSVGAGDTAMDGFLNGVGLAVQVGRRQLPFRGTRATIQVENVFDLGDLLFRLVDLQRKKI